MIEGTEVQASSVAFQTANSGDVLRCFDGWQEKTKPQGSLIKTGNTIAVRALACGAHQHCARIGNFGQYGGAGYGCRDSGVVREAVLLAP